MKKYKHFSVIISVVLILSLIIGCGSQNPQSSETEEKNTAQTVLESDDSVSETVDTPETTDEEMVALDTENMSAENLSYDIYMDAENGLLYSADDGSIVDRDGNPIPEYNYFTVLEDGSITDGEDIMEGIFAGRGGQIVVQFPDEVDYGEMQSPLEVLRSKASEFNCTTDIFEDEDYYAIGEDRVYTRMEDDGDYFDEVVLGAWFNEDGTPTADLLPKGLSDYLLSAGIYTQIKHFHFLDGETLSMDELKRSRSSNGQQYADCYAMILQNIEKKTDDKGNPYFVGIEYTSSSYVVVKGSFEIIQNHDDLLVFSKYTGLATDDTPTFTGGCLYILGDRLY